MKCVHIDGTEGLVLINFDFKGNKKTILMFSICLARAGCNKHFFVVCKRYQFCNDNNQKIL